MDYSASQLALKAYIEKNNAEHSDNLYSVNTDLDHWARYSISNIKEYDHYMASEAHSQVFRDIYGVKPRYIYENMSTDEIQSDINTMLKHEMEEQQEQKDAEAKILKQRRENNKPILNRPFSDLKSMMKI
jgi:nitrogen fixation/metabolism regulation signal transduction histidine kinase